MENYQTGILQPVPGQACYLTFDLVPGSNLQQVAEILHTIDLGDDVIGIGQSLLDQFNKTIPGHKVMPDFASTHFNLPSTPGHLWCWLRGNDQGELLHRSRRIIDRLSPVFDLTGSVDAFRYDGGRDLTGYEDGTENPVNRAAVEAAICAHDDQAISGSSFVAVQQWQHDLDAFDAFSNVEQDNMIGRRRSDNEELDDAPASAHVKRTAQESFEPEAFLVRRSMPWSRDLAAGLMFVAFGHSFNAFEAQLKRMLGNDDGIEDSLFKFSQVLNGAYYWCPPLRQGRLNLTAFEQAWN
jgi:putative iron-dependent peroxidase